MKIARSKKQSWEEKQGYSKKIIFDEKEIKVSGSLIQEVKIKSGEVAQNHHHKKQTEIFYFLTKEGYWIINGEKIVFEIGDVLIIEPNDRHKIVNDSDHDYIYLAIKFNYENNDLYWEN